MKAIEIKFSISNTRDCSVKAEHLNSLSYPDNILVKIPQNLASRQVFRKNSQNMGSRTIFWEKIPINWLLDNVFGKIPKNQTLDKYFVKIPQN